MMNQRKRKRRLHHCCCCCGESERLELRDRGHIAEGRNRRGVRRNGMKLGENRTKCVGRGQDRQGWIGESGQRRSSRTE